MGVSWSCLMDVQVDVGVCVGGVAGTRPGLSLLAKALGLPTQSLWTEGRSGTSELRPESEGKQLAAFKRLGMRAEEGKDGAFWHALGPLSSVHLPCRGLRASEGSLSGSNPFRELPARAQQDTLRTEAQALA